MFTLLSLRIRRHFYPPLLFFFLSHAFFHLSNFRFSLFFSPRNASALCQDAKEQLQRHAGSVFASRTARTGEHFVCEVREASTLRRGTQASLLITTISILSGGTTASIGRSLGGEGSEVLLYYPPSTAGFFSFCHDGHQLGGPYK